MATSRRSNPTTPPKTRIVTKTITRTVEERTPDKSITCTKSRSSRLEIVTTPSEAHHTPPSVLNNASDDSDDPNDDATITFATDSEDESHPPSIFLSTQTHVSLSPSISSVSSLSRSSDCPPNIPDSDRPLVAHYEARYPGKVPHPNTLKAKRTEFSPYYVVFAGLSVGIFGDWEAASDLVTGVSHAKHRSYPRFHQAWFAYFKAYQARRIRVLGQHQDTAPVEYQIADSGLEPGFANISLS
ncbi:hypothetical protein V5O48_015620 [Marasmius crinis-equi]|uniref:Ribonuclease H1 N-terminal domain-containing protein n=1 Tax=Marasmius crinis-equi TaxID=585013 RepID=A0ABR3EUC0_9AGAR